MIEMIRLLRQQILPVSTKRLILRYTRWPPVGHVRWGQLRSLKPISRNWGYDRGLPIDRYYIEQFLSEQSKDIQGHALEIKDNAYTLKYGGNRVTKSDVLSKDKGNPLATIVADLTRAEELASNVFDCIICTQTLQQIFEIRAAIRTLYSLLRPGGVVLATVPGISQIDRVAMQHWGDYWRLTSLSIGLLFTEHFPFENVIVRAYGNLLSSIALLQGISSGELEQKELVYTDPDYELLITIRAEKPKEIA
jgi:SAM-dependent methyltransferase